MKTLPSMQTVMERHALLALTACLIATLVPAWLTFREHEEGNAAARAHALATERADNVAQRIDIVIASARPLVDALSAGSPIRELTTDRLVQQLLLAQQVIGVAVVDHDGIVEVAHRFDRSSVTGRAFGNPVDVSDRPYFQQARQSGQPFVSNPYLSRIHGDIEFVAVSMPWFDRGRFGGIVVVSLAAKDLAPAFSGSDGTGPCFAIHAVGIGTITADPCFPQGAVEGPVQNVIGKSRWSDRAGSVYASAAVRNRPGWQVVTMIAPPRLASGTLIPRELLLALLVFVLTLLAAIRVAWPAVFRPIAGLSAILERIDLADPRNSLSDLRDFEATTAEVASVHLAVTELIERTLVSNALEREERLRREEANRQLAEALVERDALVAARTEDLRTALADARAADLAKSRLLANASHELRTPLNGIVGIAELLALRSADARTVGELHSILRCADTMRHLVDDLLTLARIDQGKAPLAATEFDVVQEARAALEAARYHSHGSKTSLRLHVEPGTPRHWVGDALRVRELLSNLIGNALKFTDSGSVDVVVECDAERRLLLTVIDTGRGIADQHLERIFEPFWQAESADNRQAGGVGLGLAIVKHWTEAMGGHVQVQSALGKGSRFRLVLPLPQATDPEASRPERPLPMPAAVAARGVLVVDDVELNRRVIVAQLSALGFVDVREARDGFEALQLVTSRDFDLVLLDCQMPVMDGYETAARIRRLRPSAQIRIIAVTAAASPEEAERCINAGMDAYLPKPVKIAALRQALAIEGLEPDGTQTH